MRSSDPSRSCERCSAEVFAGIPGNLNFEIRLPKHFEQIAELVDEKTATKDAVVGPDQERFIDFFACEVMPEVRTLSGRAKARA